MAYPNGYGYRRNITVDNTKVLADATDFPILFSETIADLADTNNGGHVESSNGDDIRFDLQPWNIVTSYQDASASISAGSADGLFFKDDGTEMYVTDYVDATVDQHSLSAWDISTLSSTNSLDVSSEESTPTSVYIGDNGTKLFVSGDSSNIVHMYNLSTAWDLSTATYSNDGINVAFDVGKVWGFDFKSDGTKLYIADGEFADVVQYDLSTPWDITSASHTNTLDVSSSVSVLEGVSLHTDGSHMYLLDLGSSVGRVRQYSLSTHWDSSTASYDNILRDVSSDNPRGVYFKPDGGSFFFLEASDVHKYPMSGKLDHEIEKYDNTTGELVSHIRIPSLSSSSDTEIWMYYGNANVSYSYEGITLGVSDTDLRFFRNQWGGSSNLGEMDIQGSFFTDYDGNTPTITPFNNGVGLREDGTVHEGYIMYSSESVHTRFSSPSPHTDNADHFIGVFYDGSNWNYDANGSIGTFTPVSSDILVAGAKWGSSSAGVETVSIIKQGSVIGDVWNDNYEGVWHLSDEPDGSGSTYEHRESTRYSNHGGSWGSMGSEDSVGGKIGQAVDFDGSDDYITIGSPSNLNITGDITLQSWINLDAKGSNGSILTKYIINNNGRQWMVRDEGSSLIFYMSDDGDNDNVTASTSSHSTDTWHHLVCTWDGSTARMYLDGTLVDSSSYTAGIASFPDSDVNFMVLRTGSSEFVDGQLDEARISSTVRSPDWIATEYNNQNDPSTFYTVSDRMIGQTNDNSVNSTDDKTLTIGNSISDIVATADTLSRIVAYSRSYADILTIVDNLAITLGKQLSETIGITDDVRKDIVKSASNGVLVSDDFNRVVEFTRGYQETPSVADTVSRDINKSVSGVVITTDDVSRGFLRSFPESVIISDSVNGRIVWKPGDGTQGGAYVVAVGATTGVFDESDIQTFSYTESQEVTEGVWDPEPDPSQDPWDSA